MTLLPDDETVGNDVNDIDIEDLRVDFSSEEASSEARDFSPVPSGNYHVAITNVDLKKSTSQKNPGKPYYAIEMTCQQDGTYKDRKFWGNVMLWNGALYSLSQLAKALHIEDEVIGQGKVPTPDQLLGEELIIGVVKVRDKYREEQNDDGEKLFKNEVKNYRPLDGSASVKLAGSGGGSHDLMP